MSLDARYLPPFRAPEPTHNCIRCGRPGVPAEDGLCELCNPLELAQPSATQVHGIAALGIFAFVVNVVGAAAVQGGLNVTILVENQGSKAAATTCRIVQAGNPVGGPGELVQTPQIAAASSAQFSAVVTKLGLAPIPLDAYCQSP